MARHSDFLFVALAATAETRHIGKKAVSKAPVPTGMIINISRASDIAEDALLDALDSGKRLWTCLKES